MNGIRLKKIMAGTLAASMIFLGFGMSAASAAPQSTTFKTLDLPTWDDVQRAKKDKTAAAAKVAEIEGLLAEAQTLLDAAREKSQLAMASAQIAEEAYQIQQKKTEELDTHAKASQAEAKQASDQAAALISQMYRAGGVDRNLELFLEGDADTADALLDRLAMMQNATERNTAISRDAQHAMNNAKSLAEQAENAELERKRLFDVANKEFEVASQAAAEALAEEEAIALQQVELQARLDALIDVEADTVDGYKERLRIEEEQRKAEEARRAEEARKAAEAARKAAEEAAKNNGSSGGGSSGGGGGGATGSWINPTPGYRYISTQYMVTGYNGYAHTGIDLVNGCGTAIRAPKAGTITFVGWMDNVGGNMIYLNHDGGYQTRYAHLSGFNSSYGQWVSQGQIIGYVGTTGLSTGCHLHYEVLQNLVFQNPMRFI